MKILCVLVLYQQKLYDCASYNSLLKYVLCTDVQLFIYDNSPEPAHRQDEFESAFVHYVSDTTNPGVSTGYNKAAIYACGNGFNKLLLLDQDSFFKSNSYVHDCVRLAKAYPAVKLFAPIVVTKQALSMSPRKLICKIPVKKSFSPDCIYPLTNIGIINSGIFVDVDAYLQVGGYNENVFLDYSDYQFIDRFSVAFKNFYLINSVIIQDFSNNQTDKIHLLHRFILFHRSLSQYECNSFFDKYCLRFIVLKRCLSLTFRCKSLCFIKSFFVKYLFL